MRVNSHNYTGDFRFRTSDSQISGSAISSHKNIQDDNLRKQYYYWDGENNNFDLYEKVYEIGKS